MGGGATSGVLGNSGGGPYGDGIDGGAGSGGPEQMPLTDVGRMVTGLLDVLDGCFNILELSPPRPPSPGVMKSENETPEDRKAKVIAASN